MGTDNTTYRKALLYRAMSVKMLSTVETSRTTNPQIAVMELEGYS